MYTDNTYWYLNVMERTGMMFRPPLHKLQGGSDSTDASIRLDIWPIKTPVWMQL